MRAIVVVVLVCFAGCAAGPPLPAPSAVTVAPEPTLLPRLEPHCTRFDRAEWQSPRIWPLPAAPPGTTVETLPAGVPGGRGFPWTRTVRIAVDEAALRGEMAVLRLHWTETEREAADGRPRGLEADLHAAGAYLRHGLDRDQSFEAYELEFFLSAFFEDPVAVSHYAREWEPHTTPSRAHRGEHHAAGEPAFQRTYDRWLHGHLRFLDQPGDGAVGDPVRAQGPPRGPYEDDHRGQWAVLLQPESVLWLDGLGELQVDSLGRARLIAGSGFVLGETEREATENVQRLLRRWGVDVPDHIVPSTIADC